MHDRYRDEIYAARREKTADRGLDLFGAPCTVLLQHYGAGPDAGSGYDLLMTDLGDRFMIKAATEKGNLLKAGYLREAGDEDRRQREKIMRKIEESLPKKMDLSRITKNMLVKYDDDL